MRVGPNGAAVLAGRAEPGATVTVQQDGRTLAETTADSRGSWLILPSGQLPPGAAALTLSARQPGGQVVAGDTPVVIVVPPRDAALGSAPPPAVALLAPPTDPARLLQAPGKSAVLGLSMVDYDEHGAIRFTGSAPPGAPIRLYVDNGRVGDTAAGPDGRWVLSPPGELLPGVHKLRWTSSRRTGRSPSGSSSRSTAKPRPSRQVAPGQLVVQPGQNLWRLARRATARESATR